ncbi:GGDEF domain-containing protein [Jeongeupia naejangsanensis]|uniref:diguanylate cyclase n=1 Tax=Jeongeupia naejangsanensis TaxID=613195 RepID=A0ABS2BNJ3_9NEIS|nr:GGDEF domain-containing protein [Jeongeupia naejangsanensis]MBM3117189.1 GGDEF domain-containing protein [Jeongeupia naejangsanensis]
MSITPPDNPVEVARIALKRLSERGLPPTPDNYAQFYNAIVTIKSPQTKAPEELQQAWQVLCQVDEAVGEASEAMQQLIDTLDSERGAMLVSLGRLQHARDAHAARRASVEETHNTLADLLDSVITSTNSIHSTVSASHSDLQSIRDSVRHIEEDLAFNRRMLEQDALTGTFNRQGLDHHLAREVKVALRNGGRLTAVIFDLDDFKQINDTHGHLIGDQVLVHVANLTRVVLRENDLLVRYGGEEFLILLTDTDVNGASYVIDRLRTVAGRTPFLHKGQRIEVSFSTGIAQLRPDENGRALLLRADEALYRAKNTGKSRTEIAPA